MWFQKSHIYFIGHLSSLNQVSLHQFSLQFSVQFSVQFRVQFSFQFSVKFSVQLSVQCTVRCAVECEAQSGSADTSTAARPLNTGR